MLTQVTPSFKMEFQNQQLKRYQAVTVCRWGCRLSLSSAILV